MRRWIILWVILLVSANAYAAITDGLLLYMPYDETSGVTTTDASGNGYDGVLHYNNTDHGTGPAFGENPWAPTSGKFGGAIKMFNDGERKVLDTHLLGKDTHDGVQDLTISFHVQRPNRHIGWGGEYGTVWQLSDSWSGESGDETTVDWHNWGDLEYDLLHTHYDEWSAGDVNRRVNIGLSDGKGSKKFDMLDENTRRLYDKDWDDYGDVGLWEHVTIRIQGDPQASGTERFLVEMFIDGTPFSCNLVSETGEGWGNFNLDALTLGGQGGLKDIDSNDMIDDYAVWTRALTDQEIVYLNDNPVIPEPATMALMGLGLAMIRRNK